MEDQHDDPPWSIPIREADPDVPHRSARRAEPLPVFPIAIGAVVVFVALVAGVVMIGGASDPGPEVLGAQASATTTAPAAADDGAATTPSTTATTAPTTTTTAPATTVTDPPSTTGTAPAVASEPDGLPIRTPDDLDDGWIAQVSSVPTSAGATALARAYETVTATVPDAIVLRGREWAPLREGFWVIAAPGFDSAEDAVGGCDASGRTGRDQCFARYLTPDDETQLTCWREESGALAGACSPS